MTYMPYLARIYRSLTDIFEPTSPYSFPPQRGINKEQKNQNTMNFFLIISLLSVRAYGLPSSESEVMTDGEFTYTGGDVLLDNKKVLLT